ncbi:MAG: AtpZ/AtpI family protein [Candidatus Gastranaerophilales bacterium]|nr:AtpZ/AtpI family protein [Candidatus Gastranaerophilales bacterium]
MDIAFSLLMPILLGAFIGHKLDQPGNFPIWTVSLSVLGMMTGFWSVYKRFMT